MTGVQTCALPIFFKIKILEIYSTSLSLNFYLTIEEKVKKKWRKSEVSEEKVKKKWRKSEEKVKSSEEKVKKWRKSEEKVKKWRKSEEKVKSSEEKVKKKWRKSEVKVKSKLSQDFQKSRENFQISNQTLVIDHSYCI